jgi:hypothetical protein
MPRVYRTRSTLAAVGGKPTEESAAARTPRPVGRGHAPAMDSLIIMLVIVVGLLAAAPFAGADSRVSDRDRRGWWPGPRSRQ